MRLAACVVMAVAASQQSPKVDWTAADAELVTHFQQLVRFDTTDPPGGERPAVDYLKKILADAGIEFQEFALEPNRPNLVARLKGSGSKRPLLLMGHTDTVNVDPAKWSHPPFSADRDGGYIYGRGTVDDKDNVSASLMVMLLLKRMNVPLDRDVIFLAEAGEEGTTRVGIQFMVNRALRCDRRRVLSRRGRQRVPHGWERPVRVGADAREDSVRRRAHRPRPCGPRLGAAREQRRRARRPGRRQRGEVVAAGAAERNDERLLQAVVGDFAAGRSRAVPRRARPEEDRGRSTPTSARTSRGTRRCCGPRSRPTSSPRATGST